MIQQNKVVSVTYTLHASNKGADKQHVETADKNHPLLWLYGVGSMIPAFEENLAGKKTGDTFDFAIDATLAYGPYDAEGLVGLPISIFQDETGKVDKDMLQVGAMIPMTDNEGNHLQGRVMEVTDDAVKMDFNHPLAGKDLHFSGEIIEVRDATADEMSHGHAHGVGGHNH